MKEDLMNRNEMREEINRLNNILNEKKKSTDETNFVKATIRENGIPFALKAADDPYIYSEENMKYLRQGIAQIEAGNGKTHELMENK